MVSSGTFTITLRDACGDPIPNRMVRIDLSGCADLTFSTVQATGVTADCDFQTATFITNANGAATVALRGNVKDIANPSFPGCATVAAENLNGQSPPWVPLGTVQVAVFDLDGVNGLRGSDYLRWLCDFGRGTSPQRSDYDFSGGVGAIDGTVLVSALETPFTSTPDRCDGADIQLGPLPASGTAFNIRWDDCGIAGTAFKSFACNTNTGTDKAVVSVVSSSPPPTFYGVQVAISIKGDAGVAIPDWWQTQPGGCSSPRLSVTSYFGEGCLAPASLGSEFAIAKYPAAGLIDRESYVVTAAFFSGVSLNPGEETGLFTLGVRHDKTVGPTACSGCASDAAIRVEWVRFLTTSCGSSDAEPEYVTVLGDYSPTVTYQGTQPAIVVISASPSKVGPAPQTLSIQGERFAQGASVLLRRSGQSDISGIVQSVASTGFSLVADFDLSGAALGYWDVVVTNPDLASASKAAAVLVEPVVPARFVATLNGSRLARPGLITSQQASFAKLGNVTYDGHAWFAYYVPAVVTSVKVSWAGTTLGTFTPAIMGSRALVGVFSVPYRPDLFPPYVFEFTAPMALGSYCSDLELFQVGGPISAPTPVDAIGTVASELIRAQVIAMGKPWPSFTASFSSAFATALDDALSLRIKAFSNAGAPVTAHAIQGELLHGAVQDALSALASGYASDVSAYGSMWSSLHASGTDWPLFQRGLPATAKALPAPPRPSVDYPTLSQICFSVSTSYDPNDKSGTAGAGDQHDIASGTPLSYLIHFENLATAGAAAQVVTVDDVLDPTRVDFSTVSLGTITFGDHVIQPPPGLQEFTQDVDLQPAHNLVARVSGIFDPETGLLSWRFRSLDPATLTPTQDAGEGFLPPNVSPTEGEGSVSFTAMPVEGVADGNVIPNGARIVFDTNAPIDTPVWSNRMDLSPPVSAVTGLTPTQGTLSFQVSWSGTDAYSGIANYSVYVSDNAGPYGAWQQNVTATSASFTGVSGHTYAFYSIATDGVGHVEAAPGSPDASTTVTVGVDGAPPLPRHLALRTLGGHPSRGALRVELALPRVAAGKIEVLDIAGRVIESRDISRLEAGWHPLTLATVRSPGLYFVRVTHGAETVTLKSVQLR